MRNSNWIFKIQICFLTPCHIEQQNHVLLAISEYINNIHTYIQEKSIHFVFRTTKYRGHMLGQYDRVDSPCILPMIKNYFFLIQTEE